MRTDRGTAEPSGPEAIIELGTAFCTAKILLTAVGLRLFTVLSDSAATESELCRRLRLHGRGSRDFLDVLVALGMLERRAGRYYNSPGADRYLVQDRPHYVGGFLERANDMLYPAWGRLTEALRSGQPQVQTDFAQMSRDPVRLAAFLEMMDALTSILAPELARTFEWSRYASVADIGGARGNLVAHLAKAYPHMSACVFDLPQMRPFFSEHIATLGLEGRIRFQAGDFFVDPLPHADVLIIGHVLHDWAPPDRRALVRKAFQAVPAKGALLVYDRMLDDQPTDPANLVISLNMLLTTPGGSEYTAADCGNWLQEAGFIVASVRRLGLRDTLVVGRKDR